MNDFVANIREKRFALLELNTIMHHVHNQYQGNPPIDVLTGIAELAKCYSKKYGNTEGKSTDQVDPEFHNFCVKNGLPM